MNVASTSAAAAGGMTMNKGQRTARRILDAAERLFAQQGYAATSLRDIAAAAEIQQPGLYKHFASKEDLYRQVYQRALEPVTDLMDRLLAEGGSAVPFTDLTAQMTDLLARHPHIPTLLLRGIIAHEAGQDEIAMGWLRRLMDYGAKISRTAGVDDSSDVLALQITAIFNLMFGFFWAAPLIANLSGKGVDDESLRAAQKRLLANVVDSLSR